MAKKGPYRYFIHPLQRKKGFIEYCILLQGYMLVKYYNFSWLSPPSPHKKKPVKYSFSVTVNKISAFVLFILPKF